MVCNRPPVNGTEGAATIFQLAAKDGKFTKKDCGKKYACFFDTMDLATYFVDWWKVRTYNLNEHWFRKITESLIYLFYSTLPTPTMSWSFKRIARLSRTCSIWKWKKQVELLRCEWWIIYLTIHIYLEWNKRNLIQTTAGRNKSKVQRCTVNSDRNRSENRVFHPWGKLRRCRFSSRNVFIISIISLLAFWA